MQAAEIESWVSAWLAANTDESTVTGETRLLELAVTSIKLIEMLGELERVLGRSIDPQIIFEQETLDQLSRELAKG